MVETIAKFERGTAIHGLALGAVCGVIIGRAGLIGLACTAPTVLFAVLVTGVELYRRELSTGTLTFAAGCGGLMWALS